MDDLAKQLQAPFPPEAVDFRPQGKPLGNGKGRVVAYVDARAVQDRLDEVFGPAGWSFTWEPLMQSSTAITVVRGTITVDGIAKSDVGDAGDTEPSKSAVSDALKRAAVHWGIGRYLYGLGASYVTVKETPHGWVPADGEVDRLRSKLPQVQNGARPQQQPAPTPALAQKLSAINSAREQLGWTPGQVRELAASLHLPARSTEMSLEQAGDLLAALMEKLGELQPA